MRRKIVLSLIVSSFLGVLLCTPTFAENITIENMNQEDVIAVDDAVDQSVSENAEESENVEESDNNANVSENNISDDFNSNLEEHEGSDLEPFEENYELNESVHLSLSEVEILNRKATTIKVIGTKEKVNWISDDVAIAKVANGKITPVATGSTTVRALVGGQELVCNVYVDMPVISAKSQTLYVNSPSDGSFNLELKNTKYKYNWMPSKPSIVSVDGNTITGIAKGTVVLKTVLNGVSYSCKVVVSSPEINKESISTLIGKNAKLSLKGVVKKDINQIVWNSDNTDVAVVDGKGKVSFVGKGNCIIKATLKGVDYLCKVSVGYNIKKIGIRCDALSTLYLNRDEIGTCSIASTPSYDIPNEDVIWNSDQPNVATIENGIITPVGVGSTTITAIYAGKKATYKIEVRNPGKVTGVYTNIGRLFMNPGDEVKLSKSIRDFWIDPSYGPANYAKLYSSNTDVVMVKKLGDDMRSDDHNVKALNGGTAAIAIKVGDVSKQFDVVVSKENAASPNVSILYQPETKSSETMDSFFIWNKGDYPLTIYKYGLNKYTYYTSSLASSHVSSYDRKISSFSKLEDTNDQSTITLNPDESTFIFFRYESATKQSPYSRIELLTEYDTKLYRMKIQAVNDLAKTKYSFVPEEKTSGFNFYFDTRKDEVTYFVGH